MVHLTGFVPERVKNIAGGKGQNTASSNQSSISLGRLLKLLLLRNAIYFGWLAHHHTVPHFDALKIYSCGKHCEKRRNCL